MLTLTWSCPSVTIVTSNMSRGWVWKWNRHQCRFTRIAGTDIPATWHKHLPHSCLVRAALATLLAHLFRPFAWPWRGIPGSPWTWSSPSPLSFSTASACQCRPVLVVHGTGINHHGRPFSLAPILTQLLCVQATPLLSLFLSQ